MHGKDEVESNREMIRYVPWLARAMNSYKSSIVHIKSYWRHIEQTSSWIRFPFYHNVFKDERSAFFRQLRFLRNYGEFLSLDEAVNLLRSGERIDGRYFCITFDDGMDGCYDHAYPILAEMGIAAAFFVMPDYMCEGKGRADRACRQVPGMKMKVRYFTWDECREMRDGGMTIGSHTCSHARLSHLPDDGAYEEIKRSKEIIEERLQSSCDHFSSPWGRPGLDCIRGKHEVMAKSLGYRSFLTVHRGAMTQGDSPFFIKRDFFYAHSEPYMLRYYFGV